MNYSADISKLPRHYLPVDFTVENWSALEPFFIDARPIQCKICTIKDASELEVVSEDAETDQMTYDTENKT